MELAPIIYKIAVVCIPVMLGIILHEVAHAYAANAAGDTTAKMQGRLTLNPIAHIDPMGTAFFVLTAISGAFIFGWAKPVPVNPRRFTNIKDLKTGMMLVSLAGPFTNFALAIAFTVLMKIYMFIASVDFFSSSAGIFLSEMLLAGIQVNIVLGIINLLPIPPLDGSHVIAKLLPYPLDAKFMSIGKYGMLILLALIFFNVTGVIIGFFFNIITPIIQSFLQ